jgi:hypothetical protein
MKKLSAKVKRPLWVAGLNIALALTVGSTQAFAGNITTVAELLAVTGDLDYILTKSLDLSTEDVDGSEPGTQLADDVTEGNSSYIPNGFTGTFDGGGFTISGLTKPLFDGINEGVITNLDLEADQVVGVMGKGMLANQSGATINNVNVTGDVFGGVDSNGVGGLVGYSGGNISGSSATGDVTGTYNVGGLVGTSYGSISGSFAESDVNGDTTVGGLVGDSNGSISNSSASGDVTGNFYVGGLVGNSTSSISGSYAEGDVVSTNSFTGGLVGYSTGNVSNSYTVGSVTGNNDVGGLVGYQYGGNVSNSYATGDVTGYDEIGGLVGYQVNSSISNSYAFGDVNGNSYVGGLVGTNYSASPLIDNSYAAGAVNGYRVIGGLVGDNFALLTHSYSSGVVTSTGGDYIGNFLGGSNTEITDDSGHLEVPLTNVETLNILNSGLDGGPIFALNPAINNGFPYLLSNPPPSEEEIIKENDLRIDFSFLLTQTLESLNKSFGFELEQIGLSKFDLAFLDQVKGNKSEQATGAKLFANQSFTTSLPVGSLLQLEITFEANKSLQMWVKSLDGQYVLVGNVAFNKDGTAVLPGIEFKKSGQYQLIFVNSDKKDLAQPELVNKVSSLTVYVN